MHVKRFIAPLLLLAGFNLAAQTPQPNPKFGYAVIRGHITHHTEPSFSVWKEGFIDKREIAIPVDKNGNFSQKIKVEGEAMDLSVTPCERRIFLHDKDTLTLNWDAKNAMPSFTAVNARNAPHTQQLNMLAKLENIFNKRFANLRDSLSQQKLTDTEKYSAINTLYNQEMLTLTAETLNGGYTGKLSVDIYFKYADLLRNHDMLPGYNLHFNNADQAEGLFSVLANNGSYGVESDAWFNESSIYRDFIYNYVRFSRAMKAVVVTGSEEENKTKKASDEDNFALTEYNLGMLNLKLIQTRDWYATRVLIDGFDAYPFSQTNNAYQEALGKIKTPYYADTLKKVYERIKQLSPGMPAPNFTLKDENGRTVSLSEFKGKNVLLDFWGVSCPPCLYDIKNHMPALHERYKNKNLVVLTVCIDTDQPDWKNNLKKLNLPGTNLLAPGGIKNAMVKAYNVDAIPHYFIIDTQGNIVNNSAPRPLEGNLLYAELDKVVR